MSHCVHALWPSFITLPKYQPNLGILYQGPPSTKWPPTPLHSSPDWPSKTGQVEFCWTQSYSPSTRYWHEEVSKGRRRLYKVSQTAGTWPQFCQNWGQNEKSQWKQYVHWGKGKEKKRGPKLSPRLLPRGISPPVLDLPYVLRLELLSQALTEQDPVNLLNWYPVLWNRTQFHSLYWY